MTRSAGRPQAPKIVQIETRYVQTDAVNFRAVVQSLTGKNSSTAWVGKGSSLKGTAVQDAVTVKPDDEGIATDGDYTEDGTALSSLILKNMSFKDFDRLFSELPPVEDFPWLVGR